MQSNILFILISVAVQVNYISSVKFLTCHSDEEVLTKLSNSRTKIVPIILIENTSENPVDNKIIGDVINWYFSQKEIKNVLVVPANQCVVTTKLLIPGTTKSFPLLFMIKNRHLIPKKWSSLTLHTLQMSICAAESQKPPPDTNLTFDFQLRTKMDLAKREEEGTNDRQSVQSVIPPTSPRQTLTRSAYPPENVQAQTTASTWSIDPTNRPFSSGWPQIDIQHSGQMRRSQPSINSGQPSGSNWSAGTTQPVVTRAWAPASDTTVHRPGSTWTTDPRTSVGVPTIRSTIPETLDLFTDERARPVKRSLETRDLLSSSVDQHQQGGQYNNASGSNLPPTKQARYFRYVNESSRTRHRTNGDSPIFTRPSSD